MQTLLNLACRRLQIEPAAVKELKVLKKSVDARDKADIHFVFHLLLGLEDAAAEELLAGRSNAEIYAEPQPPALPEAPKGILRPVVVGAGPAGLVAALILAKAGARPLLIERGRPVEQRQRDVAAFFATGRLDPSSNALFGEGGAGAFSDGKLTTGIKSPYIPFILKEFAKAGAPEEILYAAKPHIGTDFLPKMLKGLRERILSLGGEIRFGTRLSGLVLREEGLRAVWIESEEGAEELPCERLLLCIGHSARDTFAMLRESGLRMEQKAFSIGLRIEHPQALIDRAQYGEFAGHPALGAAEYKLSCHLPGGRSVYSFCMCPGGRVLAATSEEGLLNINGMSAFARDGENANSALLCSVEPGDFGGEGPLAGIEFQRRFEKKAFEAGGGRFFAPAQLVGDFLAGRESRAFGAVRPSFAPGVTPADLRACLPGFAAQAIREALPQFARRVRGFTDHESVLTGVETRSSSPLRIPRDQISLQSSIFGLYPCGEGAGYAGGILSAAADGARCAAALLEAAQNSSKGRE
ncbi:MAG: FAD-dependent monooxygenase [Christensenellaceae bacterium]|nr:FAD-dependent monooxygenase [Christensenellaceae bacterium]